LRLADIADGSICCGSAGIYNLVQPEAARELGQRKAENVAATGADVLVTGNPGCAMQIASALAARGAPMPMRTSPRYSTPPSTAPGRARCWPERPAAAARIRIYLDLSTLSGTVISDLEPSDENDGTDMTLTCRTISGADAGEAARPGITPAG